MDKTTKKDLGAFYTPNHTVRYMINHFSSINKDSRLLEPCGGDGAFINEILSNKLLKPNQIDVWDINSSVKEKLSKFKVNLTIKDSLIDTDFQSLFKNLYTHIISNPPYLNKQSQYIKKNKNILRKLYDEIGVNDTYALFLYLSCNLLQPNGELVFIISDTYRTLGIHKELRHWLLKNMTIKKITICPASLFKETGTLVKTSIIHLINKTYDSKHYVEFNDCRNNELGDYKGVNWKVKQSHILNYPDFVFYFENNQKLLDSISHQDKKIIDFVYGGLGMHTTDNKKYLAKILYDNNKLDISTRINNSISINEVKKGIDWKIYHKTGGDNKYYKRPEYAIKWDKESIGHYKSLKGLEKYIDKQGFVISGVCSSLSARLSSKGALWESNKAMCFFPKDKTYSVYFFIGILNSKPYNSIIKVINHTNSIQIRDIKKLPMFDFEKKDIDKISEITKEIILGLKKDILFNFEDKQKEIDTIIYSYINKHI